MQFNPDKFKKMFDAEAVGGEREFSPLERAWLRPTIEVNGITGGYGGAGFKTVIPAKATAKLSCRLVPNQDPEKVGKLVSEFLHSKTPKGLVPKVHIHSGGGPAVKAKASSTIAQAFAKAYNEVFQAPCQFTLSGGSIPIVAELTAVSKSEMILMGLGLPDDQIHAPNEHFGLDRIEQGFLVIARAIQHLRE